MNRYAPRYTPQQRAAALEDARYMGVAAAARKHGMTFHSLYDHARRRGIRCQRVHRGGRKHRPEVDADLAILRALFPEHVTFTKSEIAHIVGVSSERVRQIEEKALRKIRHAILDSGLWQERRETA